MKNSKAVWIIHELDFGTLNQIKLKDITYNFNGSPDSWNLDTWMRYSYLVYKIYLFKHKQPKYLNNFSDGLCEKWVGNYRAILYVTPRNVAMLLRTLRKQNKYTLAELSGLTGFSKTSIAHRESNNSESFPNLKTIMIYLNIFNVSLIQFLFLLHLYATSDALGR